MNVSLHYKAKQFFFVLIKISIVVGAFYFIYSKVIANENLKFLDFISFLKQNDTFSVQNIIFLIFLSFFNWFFEILKWQHLVKTINSISFNSAFVQSFAALTTSLITPNRIGDYGAKAMYYSKPLRTKIILLNLIGNLSQMSITMITGSICFLLFTNRYHIDLNYFKIAKITLFFIIVILFTFLGTKQKHFKIKGFSMATIVAFTKSISITTKRLTLLLSLLRYAIFSFQFFVLLRIFSVDISYMNAMIVISSFYLLSSIIPTIAIFDVIVKGGIAVYLFGYLGIDELTILSITTLMWLLNFVLPSVIGSYFVLNFKFPKPISQC
ncbi:flippase-like domain-containing protein [Winogradskyella eckloniae]|uniref:lysylphosphatidylglycerol synthase domain-containing protein n=1 Tax=Winogradskyella eckloniae TaxID=1089306 RepID=UPI001566D521|nr:lysylphosphatidylglycerol synthase domain-containing protein [Winogradskyella eckloniae]NRD19189.1 flippase-like domain-containing protein [Winogradskyella eckloniae]